MTGHGVARGCNVGLPLRNGFVAPAAAFRIFALPGSGIPFKLYTSLRHTWIFTARQVPSWGSLCVSLAGDDVLLLQ